MKRVLITALVILLLAASVLPGIAAEEPVYSIEPLKNGTAKLTGVRTDAKALAVPDSIDGYRITAVAEYCFEDCYTLRSVTLPETIEDIAPGAFAYCSSLTDIYVDRGNEVFASSDGVLYSVKTGTLKVYPMGREQEKYILPDGITEIDERAFYGAGFLEELDLPDSLTSIGDYAFLYCTALERIRLPAAVVSIGKGAFAGCLSLRKAELPEDLESIGADAFSGCFELERIELPEKLISIEERTFCSTGIKKIEIPEGVTHISSEAFAACEALKELTLPRSVSYISPDAFTGSERVELKVSKGSYAELFAQNNNIDYSYIK